MFCTDLLTPPCPLALGCKRKQAIRKHQAWGSGWNLVSSAHRDFRSSHKTEEAESEVKNPFSLQAGGAEFPTAKQQCSNLIYTSKSLQAVP